MEEIGSIGLRAILDNTLFSGPMAQLVQDELLAMRTTEDMENTFDRLGVGLGSPTAGLNGVASSSEKAAASMSAADAEISRLSQSADATGGAVSRLTQAIADADRQFLIDINNLNQMGQSIDSLGARFSQFGTKMVRQTLGVSNFKDAIFNLGGEAAKIGNIQASFERMGGSLDEMLAATNGMVPAQSLMTNYNRAAMLVSRTFAQQLPEAMGYLQQVAMATGDSMDYLLRSIVIGVGRLSPLILDNLGITLKLSDAYKIYAAQTGLVADKLTKTQQQAAAMNYVLEQFRRNFGEASTATDNAALMAAKYRVRLEELKLEIGKGLIPLMQELYPAMTTLSVASVKILGGEGFKNAIKSAAELLGNVLSLLTRLNAAAPNLLSIVVSLSLMSKPISHLISLVPKLASILVSTFGLLSAQAMVASGGILAIGAAITAVTLVIINESEKIREQQQLNSDKAAESAKDYEDYVDRVVIAEARRRAALAAGRHGLLSEGASAEEIEADAQLIAEEQRDAIVSRLRKKDLLETEDSFAKRTGIVNGYVRSSEAIVASQANLRKGIYDTTAALNEQSLVLGSLSESSVSGFESLRRTYSDFAKEVRMLAESSGQFAAPTIEPGAATRNEMIAAMDIWQAGYASYYQSMADAKSQHIRDMEQMDLDDAQKRAEAQWNNQNTLIQSELDFQARLGAAKAMGNEKAANELITQHEIDLENLGISNSNQELELERSLLQQRIIRQRAYVQQLKDAQTAFDIEFANKVMADKSFLALDSAGQQAILGMFSKGQQERVRLAKVAAEQQAAIDYWLSQGQVHTAARLGQLYAELAAKEVGAAQKALTDLETQYQNTLNNIQASFRAAAFDPQSYKVPEKAASAAASSAESATAKLAKVAADIAKGISDAETAIFKLATFTIPQGTKEGLKQLREYLLMAVRELYKVYETFSKEKGKSGLAKLAENMGYINTAISIIKPTLDSIKALTEYESALDLPDRMYMFTNDMYNVLDMMGNFALSINKDWLKKVGKQIEPLAQIFSVVSPIVDAMKAVSEYQTGNMAEVLDVFEIDMMLLLARLGSIGQRMTREGVANAQLFRMGAEQAVAAVSAGLSLIQGSVGQMIDVDMGGTARYAPISISTDTSRAIAQGYATNSGRSVQITFGDIYVNDETDWNRLENMVRQVVIDEVR